MNRKTLIAVLACAAVLPGAARAELAVYGQLQAELARVSNDGFGENYTGGKRTPVATGETAIKLADNRRGRLGVKLREDLGLGLAAIARFEWQVNTVAADPNDGRREAWVGLAASWGEIKAGRLRTPYKYTGGVNYDPFAYTYLEARLSGGMKGGPYGQNGFWDTSLSYRKQWGGFGLWVAYGLDQGNGTTNTPSNDNGGNAGDLSAALTYRGHNWELFVAGNRFDADNDGGNDSVTKLGGRLELAGRHTFSAQLELDNPDGNNNNARIGFLGYQFRINKNIIAAQFGRTDGDANYAVTPAPGALAERRIDTTYYALGVIHRFTPQTRIFAGYRKSAGKDNNDLTVYSAGLRIDF